MNILIEQTKQKIMRIRDTATERSYYPLLCEFFQEYAKTDAVKLREVLATPEETTTQYQKKVGFPDITIRSKNQLIGWIEVKTPEENLAADKFNEQFGKYKDSLENIIFTNLREWQLWQWQDGESKQVGKTIVFDLTKADAASEEDFEQLLVRFFEGRAYQARTPKQLALALARKTRLLSKQVEEALESSNEKSDLWQLKETFEKTLIQDISSHQFANMVAETMAYSLFLSALEHERRGNGNELTLTNAIDYLPTNVPILADLYGLIKKVASTIPNIYESAQLLVDQLNASEIERIRQKLVEHKPGEDPVIQFYEPFLAEYDPTEREARGVYYTPKPVVDYIVRSVDWILRNKFGKEKGLADESVNLLDPATGTGTFLMSAIQEIYWNTKKANEALGDEMVSREFNKIVLNHILKHFYGFELLIAPYAVAHLKLTLELERLGFDFGLSKGDGDAENDRFKVYLANTLDDPNKPPAKLFGFDSIPQESEKAQAIKRDVPILAIIGNPPYSNFGRMNRGDWILDLLKDYKKGLGERKINLDDDFIKFIRFAQWKLETTGQGIFAMITSNTFIDGITHRQMRRSLMDTFDEIYIYNLHGNSRKGEVAPDGAKDENVFNIQQGVSINIFVRLPEKQGECVVKYCDLWGSRDNKFGTLLEESFDKTNWKTLEPKQPNWFFVPKDIATEDEYSNYIKIAEIFPAYNSGIQTKRDNLTIQYSKTELQSVINDIETLSVEDIRNKYALPADGRDWTIRTAKNDLKTGKSRIVDILYRPFDIRKTVFSGKTKGFLAYPRTDTMRHMLKDNLGFITSRQQVLSGFRHILATNDIIESGAVSLKTKEWNYLFPLYIYSGEDISLLEHKTRTANISLDHADEIAEKIELTFVEDGRGDLEETFGPEDIFYYTYAVFHSPTYRSRYAEQLKIDFPRLPITSSKELFKQLVAFGNELVNLHLLGENPFDSSKTILDEPNKWSVKIGGSAPANLEDWKVTDVRYDAEEKRVYVNAGQYFEGIETEVWEFMIGGYQVCEKWLKDRKKADRILSTDDLKHYMKMVVTLRETIRLMSEIDKAIPEWPMK
jgi:predicted helicase